MTTSHIYVQREGSENVSEQFLGKFKFFLQSSASSRILENTFFMHMFFIKCSCQNRAGLMFLKRCRDEKTNGWNKAGMCLLCLGKNHHFCRAFRATFKPAGSGTGSCGISVHALQTQPSPQGSQELLHQPLLPCPDWLDRHQLSTDCTFPGLCRHRQTDTVLTRAPSLPCCRQRVPRVLAVNLHHLLQPGNTYL